MQKNSNKENNKCQLFFYSLSEVWKPIVLIKKGPHTKDF